VVADARSSDGGRKCVLKLEDSLWLTGVWGAGELPFGLDACLNLTSRDLTSTNTYQT